ncbi:MAG: hypothetical protein JNM07_09715 [Phycisphaerae bacterium]|nr:hypothetical protein [Phycisphaerae bacterium]
MTRITSWRSRAGIEISPRRVRAAVVHPRSATVEMIAFDRIEPEQPVSMREATRIAAALVRHGWDRGSCALLSPSDGLYMGTLDLPPRSSGAPVDRLARAEVARVNGWTDDAFEITTWDLPERERASAATRLGVAACTHRDLEPLLQSLDDGGLHVGAVIAKPCALARACERHQETRTAFAVLIDVDWDEVTIGVLARGTLVYARTVPNTGLGAIATDIDAAAHCGSDASARLLRLMLRRGTEEVLPADHRLSVATDRAVAQAIGRHIKDASASLSYAASRFPDLPLTSIVISGMGSPLLAGHAAWAPARCAVIPAAPRPGDDPAARAGAECTPALGAALHLEDEA